MTDKLKVVIANVVAILGLTLLFELLIYLGLSHPNYVPDLLIPQLRNYYLSKDRQIIQITDCARYDSGLFYVLATGRCTFRNREFETTHDINRCGVRDDERSLHHPLAIFLGDSYTMGWGVGQDESFPQLLERETGNPMLNAGISSYGTARELMLLKRLPVDSVEYVFIQYHPNDYTENHTFITHHNKLPVKNSTSYDSLRKARGSNPDYVPFKHVYGFSMATGGMAKAMFTKKKTARVTDTQHAAAFMKVVKAHQEVLSQRRVFVFQLGTPEECLEGFEPAIDSLLKTSEFADLPIRTITIRDFGKEDFFLLDDHLNKKGHERVAATLYEEVFSKL